jgi:hypothetical protein
VLSATVVALVLWCASPSGAEGAGYGGDAGTLRARVLAADGTADRDEPAGSTPADGPDASTLEVEASGFLANSRVVVRIADRPEAEVSADGSGSFVVRLPLRSSPADPLWVTASGTSPSFERRQVSTEVPAPGTAPIEPGSVLLAIVVVALAGSAARGIRRSHRARPEPYLGPTERLVPT